MRGRDHLRTILSLGLVLVVAGALLAQGTPEQGTAQKSGKTLVVNGKAVDSQVLDIDGRSYVDVESLAQLTNGTVTVEPNRIVLTIPVASSGASSEAAPLPTPQGLSKDFVRVAIADLAEMGEWKGAISTMITYGLAVSEAWAQGYHDAAQEELRQATVAASTDADHQSLALLQSQFDRLAKWADGAIAARQALNGAQTIDPTALQNDPALAKINDCGQFLSAMLVSGVFTDNATCH